MIYWIAILSLLIAIEVIFIGTGFSFFFPPHSSALVQDFFLTYQHSSSTKHDLLFFRLFIIVGLGSFLLLMRFFQTQSRNSFFKYFTGLNATLVVIEAFFLFKYATYRYPIFQKGFYFSLVLSALVKIFCPEIIRFLQQVQARLQSPKSFSHLPSILTWVGMGLIALIVWVPDVKGVVARMFIGEQFHHIDGFLISPGWSFLMGNVLGVDTTVRYGIGSSVIVAWLAQHLGGGFNYISVVTVMMVLSVIYYWIWFYALRHLFNDAVWAFIAIFLGLRLQFFHIETFPFIFTYPQITPMRFFCDSLFFLAVILHVKENKLTWLYAAAVVAGFAPFYMTGEGAYTLITYYAFLFFREFQMKPRLNQREIFFLLGLPVVVLAFSLWMEAGPHLFQGVFWSNQLEYARFYQAGNSTGVMFDNLTSPYVDRASIAFLLPVFYVFLLMVLLGRLIKKSLNQEGFVAAVGSIFLLMSYHYQIVLGTNVTSYLRNGVIIAMISIFIIKSFAVSLSIYHQRLLKLSCGFLVLIITVTNHMFLLHPNIFNLSRNPMTHPVVSQFPVGRDSYFNHLFISYPDAFKLSMNGLGQKDEMMLTEKDFDNDAQLKEFFDRESDYSQDAALIDSLTVEGQKVPVVSSFENLILMQAKRRPFFYAYAFVNSQPRRMRKFPVTLLYTYTNLKREINLMEDQKPVYIFVEKTYLVSPIPRSFLYDNEDTVRLLQYVFSRYQPYKMGGFLVALKRI